MQVIYENKDEKGNSRRADTVDLIVYIEGISRYMEGKYARRLERRITGI